VEHAVNKAFVYVDIGMRLLNAQDVGNSSLTFWQLGK